MKFSKASGAAPDPAGGSQRPPPPQTPSWRRAVHVHGLSCFARLTFDLPQFTIFNFKPRSTGPVFFFFPLLWPVAYLKWRVVTAETVYSFMTTDRTRIFSSGSRGGGGGDARPPCRQKKKKKKEEEKEKKIGPGIRQVRPPQHDV